MTRKNFSEGGDPSARLSAAFHAVCGPERSREEHHLILRLESFPSMCFLLVFRPANIVNDHGSECAFVYDVRNQYLRTVHVL